MRWMFEIAGVMCERLDDGRLKCSCGVCFFTLKDLIYHIQACHRNLMKGMR